MARLGLDKELNARGRAVVQAFLDARKSAPGFLLSCGVFPEVSEIGTERLHAIVHAIAVRHLNGRNHDRSLRQSIRRSSKSAVARDRVERELNALLTSETTAAYVFGLAAGLGLGSIDDCLRR